MIFWASFRAFSEDDLQLKEISTEMRVPTEEIEAFVETFIDEKGSWEGSSAVSVTPGHRAGPRSTSMRTCVVTMVADTTVTATFTAGPTPPKPPPPPAPPPGTATVAATAPVKGGKALLKFSCPGPGACTGVLKLFAKLKQGDTTKNLLIGKGPFSLAAGVSQTLKVKIANAQAKRLLKQGKTLKARVKGTGVKPGTVKLKPTG